MDKKILVCHFCRESADKEDVACMYSAVITFIYHIYLDVQNIIHDEFPHDTYTHNCRSETSLLETWECKGVEVNIRMLKDMLYEIYILFICFR